jgi:hypothetical protein
MENSGDVIKSIGRESLEGSKIDLVSDAALYQVVNSQNALFEKIAKTGDLAAREKELLNFLRGMRKLAQEGDAALQLPGGQLYKIVINGKNSITGALRTKIERIVQIVDVPGF